MALVFCQYPNIKNFPKIEVKVEENFYAHELQVFLATKLNRKNLNLHQQEGDEAIFGIVKVGIYKLKKMIVSGELECGPSLASLNLFFLNGFEDLL